MWWKDASIYHVYVRSFQDSNGDGVGDLPGLLSRLPYLESLGVGSVWLSPIHPSPDRDFGYDVADYRAVNPRYGTLQDLVALREALHARGMRLVLDLVPNHTSDRHAWFAASRSARDSRWRDYYVWRDPGPDGGPPNNWLSVFGGPAWTFDEGTGQYYLHSFLKEQPDLDHRNPEVREAMLDVMRHWLDLGVDGFRVDAIQHLMKSPDLSDNPPNPDFVEGPEQDPYGSQLHVHDMLHPDLIDVIHGFRALVDSYGDRLLLGEVGVFDQAAFAGLFGDGTRGLHLGLNFELMFADSPGAFRRAVDTMTRTLHPDAWPTLVLGSHDAPRLASRMGEDDDLTDARVRCALGALLLTRGTPILYYGDELGLRSSPVPPEAILDPLGRRDRDRGGPHVPGGFGRDPSRAPMPWCHGPKGGFTKGEPWLPVGDPTRSVEDAEADPASTLQFVRRLLALRRRHPALAVGEQRNLGVEGPVWAFERVLEGERLQVALNLTAERVALPWEGATVVVSSHRAEGTRTHARRCVLEPYEVLVLTPG